MTTTAATWFYNAPEKVPYLVSERVNTTYWEARIGQVLFRTEKVDGPFVLSGMYATSQLRLEWEPNQWLRLTADPAVPVLVEGTRMILRRKPFLRYETPEGASVWEWWLAGGDKRWQEIQGKPAYRNPVKL